MSTVDATLKLEGEFGERDLFELGEQLARLLYRGNRRVVVDFSGVTHVDFRGVKALRSVSSLFQDQGGGLKLWGLSPYLKAIFRAAQGRGALEIYDGAEDASKAFVQSEVVLTH